MKKDDLKEMDAVNRETELLREIEQLKRQIAIKDAWCGFLVSIGFDYDGYNQVSSLKSLIDELVKYARFAINNEDGIVMYESDEQKFNILDEVIEKK